MENQKLIPISDLFKKSFEFYQSKFYTITTLALIPFAGFVVVSLANQNAFGQSNKSLLAAEFIVMVIFLITLVINFWVQVTYFYLIKEKEATIGARGLLATSSSQLGHYAWVLFLMGVITIAGFLLFIIPGIIFTIWFGLALYVFVFEDSHGMIALHRSRELVKGYWWPIFGRMFLFGIISALVSAIPVFGNIVTIFFIAPLGVIYGYFIYQDLKQIKATI